jgi:hypothetical protein
MIQWFDIAESHADKMGNSQRTRSCDMTEGVAAHVAVISRVRQFTDADAIEHDPYDALEM